MKWNIHQRKKCLCFVVSWWKAVCLPTERIGKQHSAESLAVLLPRHNLCRSLEYSKQRGHQPVLAKHPEVTLSLFPFCSLSSYCSSCALSQESLCTLHGWKLHPDLKTVNNLHIVLFNWIVEGDLLSSSSLELFLEILYRQGRILLNALIVKSRSLEAFKDLGRGPSCFVGLFSESCRSCHHREKRRHFYKYSIYPNLDPACYVSSFKFDSLLLKSA